jgi:hypothetical protein
VEEENYLGDWNGKNFLLIATGKLKFSTITYYDIA